MTLQQFAQGLAEGHYVAVTIWELLGALAFILYAGWRIERLTKRVKKLEDR